jgi:hypothetical protein
MPNRWPISSGNWSDSAIWSGSLIPTASDAVYANNQSIYIDTDITVQSLNNSTISGVTAGGSFYLNNNTIITANITNGSSTDSVQITGSNSSTIIGNLTGGPGRALTLLTSSNVTIIGNISSGGGASFHGVTHNSTGNLIISGTIISGATPTAQAFGINHIGFGNIYLTGSIYSNGTVTIANGINSTGVGNIYVLGNITGSLNAAAYGINKTSIGDIYVTGNCLARTGSAIFYSANNVLNINGIISSSIVAPGIQSSGTTATNLFTGPFYNTGSFNAVYAYRMQIIEPASTSWRFDTDTGGSKTLYTSNQLPGVPRQNDVRKGTQYNFGLTGSLEMPDPTTVKQGVAVDNTTGSAILTAQDMFDVLTQNIVQTGSIGETLDNVSTVQTVAATVSAFKV